MAARYKFISPQLQQLWSEFSQTLGINGNSTITPKPQSTRYLIRPSWRFFSSIIVRFHQTVRIMVHYNLPLLVTPAKQTPLHSARFVSRLSTPAAACSECYCAKKRKAFSDEGQPASTEFFSRGKRRCHRRDLWNVSCYDRYPSETAVGKKNEQWQAIVQRWMKYCTDLGLLVQLRS